MSLGAFLLYSLVHPVVLDVPMKGNLITGINVDSVALHAVLLLFLLLGAEVEVSGPTHLARRVVVRWRLHVERPRQLLDRLGLLSGELSRHEVVVLAFLLRRGRGVERGARQQNVAQP